MYILEYSLIIVIKYSEHFSCTIKTGWACQLSSWWVANHRLNRAINGVNKNEVISAFVEWEKGRWRKHILNSDLYMEWPITSSQYSPVHLKSEIPLPLWRHHLEYSYNGCGVAALSQCFITTFGSSGMHICFMIVYTTLNDCGIL